MNEQIKSRIDKIKHGELPEGYKRTKIGIMPNKWNLLKLGDQLIEYHVISNDIKSYQVYSSSRKGLIPQSEYYNDKNTTETILGYKLVPNGYITYRHMSDDDIFHFNINNESKTILVSSEYPVFTVSENANKIFILSVLNNSPTFRNFCRAQKMGGTRTRLYFKNLLHYKIPVPPIEEQNKIAEILSTCDKIIELKEKLLAEKQKQKKWLMQNLLTGKKRLPGFTGKWREVKLGEVCEIIMGQSPNSKAYNEENDGIPLIQGNEDICNRLASPRMYTTQITKRCLPNDIIMSIRAPVGKIAISKIEACIGRGVCVIRPRNNLNYYFQYMTYYEDKWGKVSQGSTFDAVNGDEIKKVNIYFPSFSEQTVIANILDMADQEISFLQKEISEYKKQEKALMQLLLTGIVRT